MQAYTTRIYVIVGSYSGCFRVALPWPAFVFAFFQTYCTVTQGKADLFASLEVWSAKCELCSFFFFYVHFSKHALQRKLSELAAEFVLKQNLVLFYVHYHRHIFLAWFQTRLMRTWKLPCKETWMWWHLVCLCKQCEWQSQRSLKQSGVTMKWCKLHMEVAVERVLIWLSNVKKLFSIKYTTYMNSSFVSLLSEGLSYAICLGLHN